MKHSETKERRSVFRVRLVGALLEVELDGVPGCAVLDASSEGLGVITSTPFQVGEEVDVVISHEGNTYVGIAQIRNAQILPSGKTRYGLATGQGEENLRRGLRHIAVTAQRDQLRRNASRRS